MSDTKQVRGAAAMPAVAGAVIQIAIRAAGAIRGGLRAFSRRWREQRTFASLDALDDATLKDIGVCRCEIPSIARAWSLGDGRSGRHFAPNLHREGGNDPWYGPEPHAAAGRMTSSNYDINLCNGD